MEIILFGIPAVLILGSITALFIYIWNSDADEKSISEPEIDKVRNYWKTHPAKPGIEIYPPAEPVQSMLNMNCDKIFGHAMTVFSSVVFELGKLILVYFAATALMDQIMVNNRHGIICGLAVCLQVISLYWTRIRVKLLKENLSSDRWVQEDREANEDDFTMPDWWMYAAGVVLNMIANI